MSDDAPDATPPEAAAPPPEGFLSRLLQLRLASILTHRYVDLKFADLSGTLMLLIQAPIIGFLIGLAFDGVKENQTIDFILAMVAVWLGCFSGCREVVKERMIFLRERRAGVPVRAYLVSKVMVLAFLAALQCLILVVLVGAKVQLKGNPVMIFTLLTLTTFAGACLGLLISSLVKSQSAAVALVPIALIPQFIFSEVTIPNPPEIVERIELAMLANWCYDALRGLVKGNTPWSDLTGDVCALLGMGLLSLILAAFFLRLQGDE